MFQAHQSLPTKQHANIIIKITVRIITLHLLLIRSFQFVNAVEKQIRAVFKTGSRVNCMYTVKNELSPHQILPQP